MPFILKWLIEDQVRYIKLGNTVTLKDVEHLSTEHQNWVDGVSSATSTNFVIDASLLTEYPRNVRAVKNNLSGHITNLDWMIIITDDFFLHHMTNIFGQLFSFKVKAVASLEDASVFLYTATDIILPDDTSAYT